MRKRLLAAAIVAGALGLFVAAPANAAAPAAGPSVVHPNLLCSTQFVASGVRIHSRPSLSAPALGEGFPPQWFDIINIQYTGGNWWAYGTDRTTKVKGYVYDSSAYLNINECP